MIDMNNWYENSYQSDMNDYYIQKKQKVLNNLKIKVQFPILWKWNITTVPTVYYPIIIKGKFV